MKIFLFLAFYFVLFFSASANNLSSELVIDQKNGIIESGEFISVIIRLWPIENPNLDEFNKIVGQTIFGGLYIDEIESMGPSENNAEVFEIKADAIVTDNILPEKLYLSYLGREIPVKFQGLNLKSITKKPKDFLILNQSIDFQYKGLIALVGLLITVAIIGYFLRNKLKTIFTKVKKDEPKTLYKNMFLSAKTRADFEKIYLEKENWIPLLTAKTQSHQDFFNTINQHQYKKNWINGELIEVETSFEFIRRSFE